MVGDIARWSQGKVLWVCYYTCRFIRGSVFLAIYCSPLKGWQEIIINLGMLVGPLLTICTTAFIYFKGKKITSAIFCALPLMFLLIVWVIAILLIVIKAATLLHLESDILKWFILVATLVPLPLFLYKTMLPTPGNASEARKNWVMGTSVIVMFFLLYPYWTAKITGISLHILKLGGGYETSYKLVESYCKEVDSDICDKTGYGTVPLKLILDGGDRIYVITNNSEDKKEDGAQDALYMFPSKVILGQEFRHTKNN